MPVQNPRITKNTTMGSATSLSPAIFLEGYRVAALDFSSGWDAANRMTFQGSYDFGTATSPTWRDLYDSLGNELQIASGSIVSATGRSIVPDVDLSLGISAHAYLRLRSGPSSAVVNPSTAISITVVLAPL